MALSNLTHHFEPKGRLYRYNRRRNVQIITKDVQDGHHRGVQCHNAAMCAVFAGTFMAIALLAPVTASAQVNKGILGFDGNSDAGYVRLRGNSDSTIVYMGPVGGNGNDRNRGRLQLRDANGGNTQSRATLFVPSGRGQLQLDDPGNDLRVRLSSSLKDKGTSTNESYGYLDLMSGSAGGRSIVWLGAFDSTPRQGRLVLRDVTGFSAQSRATLFLPSGRGQLQLDDAGNDLRVRLSSSLKDKGTSTNESYGYLDLMSGSGGGGSIVWLGAFDSTPRQRRLVLRDATGSSAQSRATLFLPSGRGQLQLDDPGNNLRVRLSSSLKDKGSSSNESYGYLDLMSGSAGGGSIAWLGASDSTPGRGRLELRDASDGRARVRASVAADRSGVVSVRNPAGDINFVRLQSAGVGGQLRVRNKSNQVMATLTTLSDRRGEECGVLTLQSTSGNSLAFNACSGEKTAVLRHPEKEDQGIYYNAMEGPEIGLYTRGRARLKGGVVEVKLPRHFSLVVSKRGLTAQLTPHDPKSRGLAIVELTPTVLKVAELGDPRQGADYEISFLVQGVRAGAEDYAVVRKRAALVKSDPASSENDRVAYEYEKASAADGAMEEPTELSEEDPQSPENDLQSDDSKEGTP